jgi:hypothetical protein
LIKKNRILEKKNVTLPAEIREKKREERNLSKPNIMPQSTLTPPPGKT